MPRHTAQCDAETVRENHARIHALLRETLPLLPCELPYTIRTIAEALAGDEQYADPQALYELLDRGWTALSYKNHPELVDRLRSMLDRCAAISKPNH